MAQRAAALVILAGWAAAALAIPGALPPRTWSVMAPLEADAAADPLAAAARPPRSPATLNSAWLDNPNLAVASDAVPNGWASWAIETVTDGPHGPEVPVESALARTKAWIVGEYTVDAPGLYAVYVPPPASDTLVRVFVVAEARNRSSGMWRRLGAPFEIPGSAVWARDTLEPTVHIPFQASSLTRCLLWIEVQFGARPGPIGVPELTAVGTDGALLLSSADAVVPDLVLQPVSHADERVVFAGTEFSVILQNALSFDDWAAAAPLVIVSWRSQTTGAVLCKQRHDARELAAVVARQSAPLDLPVPDVRMLTAAVIAGESLAVTVSLWPHDETDPMEKPLATVTLPLVVRAAEDPFTFTYRLGNMRGDGSLQAAVALAPRAPLDGRICALGEERPQGCAVVAVLISDDAAAAQTYPAHEFAWTVIPRARRLEGVSEARLSAALNAVQFVATATPGVPVSAAPRFRGDPAKLLVVGDGLGSAADALKLAARLRGHALGAVLAPAFAAHEPTEIATKDTERQYRRLLEVLRGLPVGILAPGRAGRALRSAPVVSLLDWAPVASETAPTLEAQAAALQAFVADRFAAAARSQSFSKCDGVGGMVVDDPVDAGMLCGVRVLEKLRPDVPANVEIRWNPGSPVMGIQTRNVRTLLLHGKEMGAGIQRIVLDGHTTFQASEISYPLAVTRQRGASERWVRDQPSSHTIVSGHLCSRPPQGSAAHVFLDASVLLVVPSLADVYTSAYRDAAVRLANRLYAALRVSAAIIADSAYDKAVHGAHNLVVLGGSGVNRLCENVVVCRLGASTHRYGPRVAALFQPTEAAQRPASRQKYATERDMEVDPASVHQTNATTPEARRMNALMRGMGAVYVAPVLHMFGAASDLAEQRRASPPASVGPAARAEWAPDREMRAALEFGPLVEPGFFESPEADGDFELYDELLKRQQLDEAERRALDAAMLGGSSGSRGRIDAGGPELPRAIRQSRNRETARNARSRWILDAMRRYMGNSQGLRDVKTLSKLSPVRRLVFRQSARSSTASLPRLDSRGELDSDAAPSVGSPRGRVRRVSQDGTSTDWERPESPGRNSASDRDGIATVAVEEDDRRSLGGPAEAAASATGNTLVGSDEEPVLVAEPEVVTLDEPDIPALAAGPAFLGEHTKEVVQSEGLRDQEALDKEPLPQEPPRVAPAAPKEPAKPAKAAKSGKQKKGKRKGGRRLVRRGWTDSIFGGITGRVVQAVRDVPAVRDFYNRFEEQERARQQVQAIMDEPSKDDGLFGPVDEARPRRHSPSSALVNPRDELPPSYHQMPRPRSFDNVAHRPAGPLHRAPPRALVIACWSSSFAASHLDCDIEQLLKFVPLPTLASLPIPHYALVDTAKSPYAGAAAADMGWWDQDWRPVEELQRG